MQKIHISTAIGFLILILSWFLFPAQYCLYLSFLSYFFIIKEVAKYTSWYQFLGVFLSAITLGLALDHPFVHGYFLLGALIITSMGAILRIVFFRIFAYTGYSWFEPLMMLLSGILYIIGNIYFHNASYWQGWVFPLPILAFTAILSFGIFKDQRQLLGFTKGGYKVEIGKVAPEFSLPDQDGNTVNLSAYRGDRNLLLIFVRGDWCPGCHMMLRAYEKQREKFQQKNILVMAIGPDPVGVNKGMVLKLGLDFKVLADEKQRTAMQYGVQLNEYDNDFAEKFEEGIPLPASFLVDKNGVLRYVSRPDKVGEFLNPSLIFPILENLH